MPPLAKQHTPQGAIAFAGYYVHALDWSFATTDSYLLHGLSTSECTICTSHITAIERAAQANEHIQGGRAVLLEAGIVAGSSNVNSEEMVRVKARQDSGRVLKANGEAADKISGGTDSTIYYLRWSNGGWKIVAIGPSK